MESDKKFISVKLKTETHKKYKSLCAEKGYLMSEQLAQMIEKLVSEQPQKNENKQEIS